MNGMTNAFSMMWNQTQKPTPPTVAETTTTWVSAPWTFSSPARRRAGDRAADGTGIMDHGVVCERIEQRDPRAVEDEALSGRQYPIDRIVLLREPQHAALAGDCATGDGVQAQQASPPQQGRVTLIHIHGELLTHAKPE